MNNNKFSQILSVFQGRRLPEEGYLAGYGALLNFYDLSAPLPDVLTMISQKHKQYETNEWLIFTPRYMPGDTLAGHLVFALKYEGIDLGILKALFTKLTPETIIELVSNEPTGQYSRKIWFLYEWLLDKKLALPDITTGNYISLVDETIQYASNSSVENSKRHRIRNNLPGTRQFCPMVRKTALLEAYINSNLPAKINTIVGKLHPDLMARTAAFLLLKDSKASYAIEGETPAQNRAQRWGRAIGQAGMQAITETELIRLQQIVIDNPRFTKLGWRTQEGFIGEHDRRHGTPIPDHISARWKDIHPLITGLIAMDEKLEKDPSFDAVLAAAMMLSDLYLSIRL